MWVVGCHARAYSDRFTASVAVDSGGVIDVTASAGLLGEAGTPDAGPCDATAATLAGFVCGRDEVREDGPRPCCRAQAATRPNCAEAFDCQAAFVRLLEYRAISPS